MHIILGGTGHIGSALASELLERGEKVTIVSRDKSASPELQRRGAQVAVADVNDVEVLRAVLQQGKRLFLLNPPADPSTDTDAAERQSVASIVAALEGSGLEKIVAQSTYGAQAGAHLGDLGVLYEMECALKAQPIPTTIIRGAYYMSNWATQLQSAREAGIIHSFYPENFVLPMVDPTNIGMLAADWIMEPTEVTGLHYVEGPRRYCANDVAAAFSQALQKTVKAVATPRDKWAEVLQETGFSEPAARSFANMTQVSTDGDFPDRNATVRGTTSLENYIKNWIER